MADGLGCACFARSSSECGCDADWTPSEVYDQREEIKRLKSALKKVQRRATKACQNWAPYSAAYQVGRDISSIVSQALAASATSIETKAEEKL